MVVLGFLSQAFVYLCFSIIMGSFILTLIPEDKRPAIIIPKGALLITSSGIALFSFFPVLQLMVYLVPNMGLGETLQSVLLTFEVGKAWLFTFIVSIFLFLFICVIDYQHNKFINSIGIAIIFLLILALGWSSHASSYNVLPGFIGDTVHFTAVSVWAGVLIAISMFSKSHANWANFLKWFTPVAIVCFTLTIASGLLLMDIIVDDYANSLPISYGQTLLLKHLLIIPLVVFAVVNGLLMKKRVQSDERFNPLPWIKAEGVLMLLIFSATAALGQQSPPRDTAISSSNVSVFFRLVYQGHIEPNMQVQFAPNATAIMLMVVTLLFLGLMLFSFIKKMPAIMTFLMGMFLVIGGYLSVMLSIK
ncbi:copper resistance D family protein [Ureibacillus sinduriensis]|uniref:Copper resistance protein CopD n=1 Tax=Ureibacillus sinduriensis BLB-1 = JCM 15800 TaxID=1384057 RepID=A0A0A3HY00_9BACL|nr:CopD family protein [Ureibacillus sinduriensis]KGR76115.1 copper resistance protein CopD [Ureibacillus sinduriensis BLB-1 = JCM 15800]